MRQKVLDAKKDDERVLEVRGGVLMQQMTPYHAYYLFGKISSQ